MAEGTTPIESRVQVRILAELDRYWLRTGYPVRSMSQLVAWSCELLCQILRANGKSVEVETIREAHEQMIMRGLYQKSKQKKGFMQMGTDLRFESMREEGINPNEYAPIQSNVVNRTNMVMSMPSMFREEIKVATKEDVEENDRKIQEFLNQTKEQRERNEASKGQSQEQQVKPQIDPRPKQVGETIWDRERKEKEIRDRENAPIDVEELRKLGIVAKDPEKK